MKKNTLTIQRTFKDGKVCTRFYVVPGNMTGIARVTTTTSDEKPIVRTMSHSEAMLEYHDKIKHCGYWIVPDMDSPGFKRLIKESHRRQLEGEDYQGVAVEICQRENFAPGPDSENPEWYLAIESSPEAGDDDRCECEVCSPR